MLIALAVGAGLYAFLPSEASGILKLHRRRGRRVVRDPDGGDQPVATDQALAPRTRFAIAFTALLLIANQVALVLLLQQQLRGEGSGAATLLERPRCGATRHRLRGRVLGEMDRGSPEPIARRRDAREELPAADFQFPQDSDRDA